MILHLEFWPTLAFIVVMASWFAFAAVFLVFFSKKPPSPPDSKRERASIAGIALQGIVTRSSGLCIANRLLPLSPGKLFEVATAIITMVRPSERYVLSQRRAHSRKQWIWPPGYWKT